MRSLDAIASAEILDPSVRQPSLVPVKFVTATGCDTVLEEAFFEFVSRGTNRTAFKKNAADSVAGMLGQT